MCRTRGWGCGRIGVGLGREAKALTQSSRREALSFAKEGKGDEREESAAGYAVVAG
jgi:hypothetical protein